MKPSAFVAGFLFGAVFVALPGAYSIGKQQEMIGALLEGREAILEIADQAARDREAVRAAGRLNQALQ